MNADDVISEVKRLADRIDNQAAGAEHDSQQVPHRAYAATAHREDAKAIRELVAGLTQKMASEEEPVEIVADDQIPEGMNNAHQFNPRRLPPRQPMSRAEKPTLKECPECEGRIESSGAQYAMCENGHRIELGQIHLPPGVRERLSSRAVEELAEAADASTGERKVSSEGPFRPGEADHLATQQRHIEEQLGIPHDEAILNRHQQEAVDGELGDRYRHVERILKENLRCPICGSMVKANGDYATCLKGHTVNVGELT